MKRTSTSQPYLSACMSVRNSDPVLLENALKSVRARAPQCEIVIVDTCSNDGGKTVEVAQRYADVFEVYRGPRGEWDEEMLAVDDMAVARQRSFELASGRWRLWLDDDDTIESTEAAKDMLVKNGLFWTKAPGPNNTLYEPEKDLAPTNGHSSLGLEDVLAWLEKNQPDATCLWSPYLYEKDEHGQAKQLLWRERIVRWDDPPRFYWQEPAHEILVPIAPYLPPRVEWPVLLWVHHKVFTGKAMDFSLARHSKIMLDLWNRNGPGDRTFRRARYLSGFASAGGASAVGPERELEFLEAALEIAWTPVDRYRGHIALGNYCSRRGLHWDAKDHYSAAQAIRPDLPDAYYAAGNAAHDREDWFAAVENFRKGTKCDLHPESEIVHRKHVLAYPSLLAYSCQRAADYVRPANRPSVVMAFLQEARDVSKAVLERQEVGSDTNEARALCYQAENAYNSERAMLEIRDVWQHLRNNDESKKALALLDTIPHDQLDHPITIEMENWAKPIRRHLVSPQAYDDFYNDTHATGLRLTTKETAFGLLHPRVTWVIDWITKSAPKGKVLDVGCCDGTLGLPLLKACPDIVYYGVDVSEPALANYRRLLIETDTESPRVTLEQAKLPSDKTTFFDVIILGEIIEHVQDPVAWLTTIRLRYLAPGGTILISTPWGAYDLGHPPIQNDDGGPRDERGHVRAYSAWKLCQDLRKAGGKVQDIARVSIEVHHYGDGMVAALTHHSPNPDRPIAVAVPSALWKWNGTVNDRDGIGASEEMLQRTGEKLAAEGRTYDVYGPIPQEEVHTGVGYWYYPTIRHVPKETKILVSRSPGYWKQVDEWIGRDQPKVLWLQDTFYGDLNNESAKHYESVITVSNWHREYTILKHGLDAEQAAKVKVIYNWLDRGHFQDLAKQGWPTKKPHRFVYASSPDRGLIKLLQLWPRVLELYPDAELDVFYGWKGAAHLGGGLDSGWNSRYLTSRRLYEKLRWQKGVREHGMVNHLKLALAFAEASVWAYPSHTFWETGCLTACKIRAAGCVPVTTALGALNETAACPQATIVDLVDQVTGECLPGYDDAWLAGVKKAVEVSTRERQEMSAEAIEKFSWEAVKDAWHAVLA